MPFQMAAIGQFFRDVQDEIGWMIGHDAANEVGRLAARALQDKLDGLFIEAPRGLGSRTRGAVEIAVLTIHVQDDAEGRGLAIASDAIEGEGLAFRVRLDSHRDSPRVRIADKSRPGRVHLPGSEGVLGRAGRPEQHDQSQASHAAKMMQLGGKNKSRRVGAGFSTLAHC
jgi:hypothetical protein